VLDALTPGHVKHTVAESGRGCLCTADCDCKPVTASHL
jgi:hypothetical protein